MRAILGDPVIHCFLASDHGEPFVTQGLDVQAVSFDTAVDRVHDERSHVVGLRIIFFPDNDGLQKMRITTLVAQDVGEVTGLFGNTVAVNSTVSFGEDQVDRELGLFVDERTAFGTGGCERMRTDGGLEVDQFLVDLRDVDLTFVRETGRRGSTFEILAQTDGLRDFGLRGAVHRR